MSHVSPSVLGIRLSHVKRPLAAPLDTHLVLLYDVQLVLTLSVMIAHACSSGSIYGRPKAKTVQPEITLAAGTSCQDAAAFALLPAMLRAGSPACHLPQMRQLHGPKCCGHDGPGRREKEKEV